MLNLVFAVVCSVAIGVIFKHTGPMDIDRTTLLTVNYAAAVGTACVFFGLGGRSVEAGLGLSPSLLGLALWTGALLIFGFFVLALATDVAGMSLAIGVMRVSVVIPFVASWVVWNEVPSVAQGIGMVLAAIAFFLIARKEQQPEPVTAGDLVPTVEDHPSRPWSGVDWYAFGILAVTFCMGGAVDLSMKAFEEGFGAENSRVLFLLLAFGVAFLIGAAIVAVRAVRYGQWPRSRTFGWGILLGVVNYGSLEFILRAIAELPGPLVFPANNIAIMVLASVLGVYVWDEHLSRPNRIGIGLAILALLMLNL